MLSIWTSVKFCHLVKSKATFILSANALYLAKSKILSCGKNYSFPKQQILVASKLKKFADNNFKFNENGIKLSKRVENTVGKGETAHYEQFLLFPDCFQKTCTADT